MDELQSLERKVSELESRVTIKDISQLSAIFSNNGAPSDKPVRLSDLSQKNKINNLQLEIEKYNRDI